MPQSLLPLDAGILVTWARSYIAALCLSPWPTAVSSRGISRLSPAQFDSSTAGHLAGAPRPPRTPLARVWGRKNKNRTQCLRLPASGIYPRLCLFPFLETCPEALRVWVVFFFFLSSTSQIQQAPEASRKVSRLPPS